MWTIESKSTLFSDIKSIGCTLVAGMIASPGWYSLSTFFVHILARNNQLKYFLKIMNTHSRKSIVMLSCLYAWFLINTAIQFKLHTKIHTCVFFVTSKLNWNNWYVDFQVVQNLKSLLSLFCCKFCSANVLFQAPLIETQAFPAMARPRPHTGSHY